MDPEKPFVSFLSLSLLSLIKNLSCSYHVEALRVHSFFYLSLSFTWQRVRSSLFSRFPLYLSSPVFHLAALEATACWAGSGRAQHDCHANRWRWPPLHLLTVGSASISTVGSSSTSLPGRRITNTPRIETDADRRSCSIHSAALHSAALHSAAARPPPSGAALHPVARRSTSADLHLARRSTAATRCSTYAAMAMAPR
jgi:hypothetical protein